MKCLTCKEQAQTAETKLESLIEKELSELGLVSRHNSVCRDCQTTLLFLTVN